MFGAFETFSEAQRNAIYTVFYSRPQSFSVLSSVHGYSLSELDVESQTAGYPKTYALVVEDKPMAVIRLENPDFGSKSIRVMLDVLNPDLVGVLCVFFDQVRHLGFSRLYAYVFSNETAVKSVLIQSGFMKEVHLESHAFVLGKYESVEIWGTERRDV